MRESLCETCALMREVVTPKGSRFLLCRQSLADSRYPKYPPQPVAQCAAARESESESPEPIAPNS